MSAEAHAAFQLGLERSRQIEHAQLTNTPMPDWLSQPVVRLNRDGITVAISGSRTFADDQVVWDAVDSLIDRQVRIIVGDAEEGVDAMVMDYMARRAVIGWDPIADIFVAHWKYQGKGAGLQRNTRLIDKADELVAIFAPGPRTPGTQDAFTKAVIKKIPVSLYHEGTWRYISGG